MKRQAICTTTLVLAALVIASGCAKRETAATAPSSFATPEEAVAALVTALEGGNASELERLLGPGTEALLASGDAVADKNAREAFLARYRTKHQLVAGGPDDLVLQVGEDDWPLPIPLVRRDGRWSLDGAAGAEEIVLRRIGANELRTIDVMRGFVLAQEEYADEGHDGAPAGVYAQTLRSEPGKHNGLYWEAAAGEAQSPAGPLLAAAAAEGYAGTSAKGAPYHGYHYRMLAAQGPAANGGARDYVVDGKLTGGFALLAWPAAYGNSGVMTFLVNQDGVVWQRDLGENTEQVTAAIQKFDPDRTWTPLAPEDVPVATADLGGGTP